MYFLVKYIRDSCSESNVVEDCILLRSESVLNNVSHRHWKQHCLFLHGITFLWLIYPFFDVWNPIGPAQVSFATSPFHCFQLPDFLPQFLSKWHIHSSQLLLHRSELGLVTLNTQAVHFSDTSEQTFTIRCESKKYPPCILWSCKR